MNHHYHTFIIEMIKHGDKQRAYNKAYPKTNGESAIKGAERLLRNPQIAAEIREAIYTIHGEAYAKACAVHEGMREIKILSIMKKREILAQLATCEMKVGRYVKGDYGYVMVYEDPRPRDIIRSIEMDTRLEEMLNNARNIEDIKLSRFDIYIDGRPCDDPTAPINPNIPQGLVMLPRKKKNLSPAAVPQPPVGGGGGFAEGGGGTLAQEISREFTGNKKEQISGETLAQHVSPSGEIEGSSREISRLTPANENIPEITGNKKEQISGETLAQHVSPSGEIEGSSREISRLTLANENIPDFTGNKKEQNANSECSLTLIPEEAIDSRPLLAPNSILDRNTEFLEEKQQRRDKDPMYDSFYKDFIRRRDQAPLPRVYTEEEIQSIKETGSPVRPLALEMINIPKSGKLIFTDKKYMDND